MRAVKIVIRQSPDYWCILILIIHLKCILVIYVYIHFIYTSILFSYSHFHTLPPSNDFSCALSSSKLLIHASYRPIILSLNLSPRNALLPSIHANLTRRCRKAVSAIPNLLLLFSVSHLCFPLRLLFPWTASHETFFYLALMQLCQPLPWIVPAISNLLLLFSASHLCFPPPITVSLNCFSCNFFYRAVIQTVSLNCFLIKLSFT